MTLALVLAGGRGSRLGQLTDWRAKPAVPFGGKFRIIDFTLSNCVNSGIRRIGVATQYKAQSLIRHVQRGWSFLDGRFDEFVELLPGAAAGRARTGTRARPTPCTRTSTCCARHAPEYVLVLAGDHVYKMDYGAHAGRSRRAQGRHDGRLHRGAGRGGDRLRRDAASTTTAASSASRRSPREPQPMPGRPDVALASMGIYVFNATFLYEQLIRDADDAALRARLRQGHHPAPGRARLPRVSRTTSPTAASNMTATQPYWRDVGTIDAYWEANMDLTT